MQDNKCIYNKINDLSIIKTMDWKMVTMTI